MFNEVIAYAHYYIIYLNQDMQNVKNVHNLHFEYKYIQTPASSVDQCLLFTLYSTCIYIAGLT